MAEVPGYPPPAADEAKLLQALRSLAGKLIMILAAHRLSAVANCHQLIDLANEITASGDDCKVNAR
jgi:ABC-type multidrug transport system fused ATPase/permease subunit